MSFGGGPSRARWRIGRCAAASGIDPFWSTAKQSPLFNRLPPLTAPIAHLAHFI
jgi:hypothetical protein